MNEPLLTIIYPLKTRVYNMRHYIHRRCEIPPKCPWRVQCTQCSLLHSPTSDRGGNLYQPHLSPSEEGKLGLSMQHWRWTIPITPMRRVTKAQWVYVQAAWCSLLPGSTDETYLPLNHNQKWNRSARWARCLECSHNAKSQVERNVHIKNGKKKQ